MVLCWLPLKNMDDDSNPYKGVVKGAKGIGEPLKLGTRTRGGLTHFAFDSEGEEEAKIASPSVLSTFAID